MRKVLITGSQGYVGSAVVQELVNLNAECIFYGLDLGLYQHLTSYKDLSNDLLLRSITHQNFNEVDSDFLSSFDYIVHLAAVSNDPMGVEFKKLTSEFNFIDVIKFANLAKRSGVKKFIFASSASVYGFTNDICNEESELNPQTEYAASKAKSEFDLKKLADEDFEVTCLRFATAAGWSKRIRMDLVLNQFVMDAYFNSEIRLNSDGQASRPIIYVKDMAKGIGFCLSKQREIFGEFEIFNIGQNKWNFQIIELAEIVVNNFPNKKITIKTGLISDNRSYKVNFDKFNEVAGKYTIDSNINDIILELIDSFDRNSKFNIQNYLEETIRLNSLRKNIDFFKLKSSN